MPCTTHTARPKRRTLSEIHQAYRFALADMRFATRGVMSARVQRAAGWLIYHHYVREIMEDHNRPLADACHQLPEPYQHESVYGHTS